MNLIKELKKMLGNSKENNSVNVSSEPSKPAEVKPPVDSKPVRVSKQSDGSSTLLFRNKESCQLWLKEHPNLRVQVDCSLDDPPVLRVYDPAEIDYGRFFDE